MFWQPILQVADSSHPTRTSHGELIPPEAGDPQAEALTQVYVRNGPGDTYPAYGIAQTGKIARVLGKSEDGAWLTVRLDPQVVGLGYGWVAIAYTQPSNIESVPVVAAPTNHHRSRPHPRLPVPLQLPQLTMLTFAAVRERTICFSGPSLRAPPVK